MLVIGDVSSIQDYVFDVAKLGGGQARRLRARSFFVQMVSECALLRILRRVGWGHECLLFSGGGKFVLVGADGSAGVLSGLAEERRSIEEWLMRRTGGGLRFSLAVVKGESLDAYDLALKDLRREKFRAWASSSQGDGEWLSGRLVLPPLQRPCDVCHRAPAVIEERDFERGVRWVCEGCHSDIEIGRKLPSARWLVVRDSPGKDSFDVLGLGVTLYERSLDGSDEGIVAVARLDESQRWPPDVPDDKHIDRFLVRHIPTENRSPIPFEVLAERSWGSPLLAVLKMDVDSLGEAFRHERLAGGDMGGLKEFSRAIDEFFAVELQREMAHEPYSDLYTVFSGGDDLVLVGPWNIALDFAGRVREMFAERFGDRELTISAGVSLFRRKRPIRRAVKEASEQLKAAKQRRAIGAERPKDQCAALGQIWKWKAHNLIIGQGKQLAMWVESGVVERGWLQTLLSLAEARGLGVLLRETGDRSMAKCRGEAASVNEIDRALASSRLAYHIVRNYPRRDDPDVERRRFREWADGVMEGFEDSNRPETVYLPAILRYAITATRKEE